MAMRIGVTHVNIPNTPVKTDTAESTWLVTTREDRWLPDLFKKIASDPILQEAERPNDLQNKSDTYLENFIQSK